MSKYVIISPVRNEEDYLEKTLNSVINQSVRPSQWILVNDGSTDNTESIIRKYEKDHDWITLINLEDRGYYFPGTGVVEVFNKGYAQINIPDWEYVVKMDCDLSYETDHFKKLFEYFNANPNLGIASGCTYLPIDGELVREPTQFDHPVGPCKVYKRKCWDQIGGLIPVPGWDLGDLLAAQMHGWETRCFFDLVLVHHRLTGSRRKGKFGPKFLQGRFEYRQGYALGYMLIKSVFHLFSKPAIIGSVGKISGYLYSAFKREKPFFEKDMRKFMRKRHRDFLLKKFKLK
ncbi:MAG: glycosyltransferase [Bacteroidetes bacterium]|jgi:glycosyltransferase involved in cell wall biosynthesis|nr:glycosyltransferase [Bacteroidota bacterium]